MNVRFCDRCKRKITYKEIVELSIRSDDLKINPMYKETCIDCANDIMNMVNYECNRYKLDTVITVSKEASENDV